MKKDNNKYILDFLNNLDSMIFVSDVDTCEILFMNQKMKDEFKITDDVLGKNCFNVFNDLKQSNCKNCIQENLTENNLFTFTQQSFNQNTDQHYKNIDSFIVWHDGRMVHLRQMTNITNEVCLQNELDTEKLISKKAIECKDDFVKRIKKNISMPLSTIIGLNNIALSTIDVRKIKKCLAKIGTETKTISEVMTGVLDMSKIETNDLDFVKEPFSFENMLLGVSNNITEKCSKKNQIFQIKMDMDMPSYFIGDESRISQVLLNLLSNSVTYTQNSGKIQLEVCQINLVNNISTIEVTVSDNGFGMTETGQKNITKLFSEKDTTNIKNIAGLGLGLPISKNIVDRLGGTMKLYSSTKIGTTISFTIKLEVFETRFFERKLLPGLNIKNLNVLFVDNQVEVCEYFRRIMKGFKINNDTKTTYLGLMDKLEYDKNNNAPYNIIFLDGNLNDVDSLSIVKLIRKKLPETHIVVLEQKELVSKADIFIEHGADKVITKPLFPSQLLDVINELVSIPNKGQMTYFSKKYNFYGKNILLVEDVLINQDIMKRFLKETKANIYTAENGQIAYEMFKEASEKYDLIVMDINMPELDGYQTTELIRKLPFQKAIDIPIIALTANFFDKDIKKCLEVGMNDYIKKPIEPDTVLDKLAKYLPRAENTIKEDIKIEKYINVDEALRRVKGNVKVYKALLGSFSKNTRFEILKKEIAQRNYDTAEKIAHSIKGAAGSLSLVEVYNIMNDIEMALSSNKTRNIDELLIQCENIISTTLKSIETYLLY